MKILSSAEDETYISIELKKTVTWHGSSDGSVRYGERSFICGVLCLIRLTDACSHGGFKAKSYA